MPGQVAERSEVPWLGFEFFTGLSWEVGLRQGCSHFSNVSKFKINFSGLYLNATERLELRLAGKSPVRG